VLIELFIPIGVYQIERHSADKLSNEGARRSSEIVGMLRELHDQLGITGSNPEAD
jgi:hypothetical protein